MLLQSARLAWQLTRLSLTAEAASLLSIDIFGQIGNETTCLDGVLELLPLAASLQCLEVSCTVGAAVKLVESMASLPSWYCTISCLPTPACFPQVLYELQRDEVDLSN